jgi:hypothetical protein
MITEFREHINAEKYKMICIRYTAHTVKKVSDSDGKIANLFTVQVYTVQCT